MSISLDAANALESAIDGKIKNAAAGRTTAHGTVTRVDRDGTPYIRLDGASDDTPASGTAATVSRGDRVNVTVRDGRLTIDGNYTDPAAGNSRVVAAQLTADTVSANLGQFERVVTQDLEAQHAHIGELEADTAKIHDLTADQLNATVGYIGDLTADNITAANIAADHATVGNLDANYAHITNGVIDNATINQAKVNDLAANYAKINGANITTAAIRDAWIDKLMVQSGLIAHEGTVYELDAIQVNASKIKAGTLDVERLVVTQDGQKYLVHVNAQGAPTYEKLDGNIIEDLTITADKIVAGAITAQKITTENIVGSGGWINLRNGTFNYTNATTGDGIAWDGQHLTINAASLDLAIRQAAQPNLTPWFSSMPLSTSGNAYWKYVSNLGTVTDMGDGWLRFQYTNSSGSTKRALEMACVLSPSIIPGGTYTWLVETRNNASTITGSGYIDAYLVQTANNQFWGATAAKKLDDGSSSARSDMSLKLTESVNPVTGYIQRTKVAESASSGHWGGATEATNELARWNWNVADGVTVDAEFRVSLYEGEYIGPWKPYSGPQLYASQAELKVTNDNVSSKVSTTDYTGATVASLINQSADTVKIEAEHIEIDGTATFNAIKSKTDAAYDAKSAASTAVGNLKTDLASSSGTTVIDGGHITTGSIAIGTLDSSTQTKITNGNTAAGKLSTTLAPLTGSIGNVSGVQYVEICKSTIACNSNSASGAINISGTIGGYVNTNQGRVNMTIGTRGTPPYAIVGQRDSTIDTTRGNIVAYYDSNYIVHVYLVMSATYSKYVLNLSDVSQFTRVDTTTTTAPSGTKFFDLSTATTEDSRTATNYITAIDSNGIRVHAANNPTNNYAKINADGMEVYKGGTSVASFGETARVGATNVTNTRIGAGSLQVYKGDESDTSKQRVVVLGKASNDDQGVLMFYPDVGGQRMLISNPSDILSSITLGSTSASGYWAYLETLCTSGTASAALRACDTSGSPKAVVYVNSNDGGYVDITASEIRLNGPVEYSTDKDTVTIGDVMTAASGITIDNFHYVRRGHMATFYFRAKPSAAKSGTWDVGTLKTGYRPPLEAGVFAGTSGHMAWILSTGVIKYNGSVAANAYAYVKATYLIA